MVAILYICTGAYTVFWKAFYESYERLFLPNTQKHYYVFTDSKVEYVEKDNVHLIHQESLGWPNNTLMRYHMFLRIEEELREYDYVFFMNANCQCLEMVEEKDFLPDAGIVVVRHPGSIYLKSREYTYDRNKKCTAYIPYGEGEVYVCGGVNGGTAEAFLEMAHVIARRIDEDVSNGVVAKWHDESHINRYIIDYPTYKLLQPEYCYPEGWDLPLTCKILIRNKAKWIDITQAKGKAVRPTIRERIINQLVKRRKRMNSWS